MLRQLWNLMKREYNLAIREELHEQKKREEKLLAEQTEQQKVLKPVEE